jgi:hypothetical protein
MWQGILLGAIGTWLILVPFFGAMSSFYGWNNFLIGIAVILIAAALSLTPLLWLSALSVTAGAWLVISAYIPHLRSGAGLYWCEIATGILLAASGGLGILQQVFVRNAGGTDVVEDHA